MPKKPARITEPLIVPGSLDPDAVKILRRLRRYNHEAYLVGGCVRDLSLGYIPKDFDIATSARPRQIKRLFRNSRIIGRRFKLVHVQFGDKIIEVSTFRKNPGDDTATASAVTDDVVDEFDPTQDVDDPYDDDGDDDEPSEDRDLLIRRDNVFGTAEEDAVRRDFTVNALFYDIDESVVLDYVGGAEDLDQRIICTIGDPQIRFPEDPVRILRAIRFAARLGFEFEAKTHRAMVDHHADVARCAPPRVTEELLKLFSCGAAERAFTLLDETGVLHEVLPEIGRLLDRDPRLDGWDGSAREQIVRYLQVVDHLDRGRRIVSNATLLTALLVGPIREVFQRDKTHPDPGIAADHILRPFASRMAISRRDAFRVKQILVAQPRLVRDKQPQGPGKRRRRIKASDLVRREYFKDALDFFRIESISLERPMDDVEYWQDIYYAHLERNDPRELRRAKQMALFSAEQFSVTSTNNFEPDESAPPEASPRGHRPTNSSDDVAENPCGSEDSPARQLTQSENNGVREETQPLTEESMTDETGSNRPRRRRRRGRSSRSSNEVTDSEVADGTNRDPSDKASDDADSPRSSTPTRRRAAKRKKPVDGPPERRPEVDEEDEPRRKISRKGRSTEAPPSRSAPSPERDRDRDDAPRGRGRDRDRDDVRSQTDRPLRDERSGRRDERSYDDEPSGNRRDARDDDSSYSDDRNAGGEDSNSSPSGRRRGRRRRGRRDDSTNARDTEPTARESRNDRDADRDDRGPRRGNESRNTNSSDRDRRPSRDDDDRGNRRDRGGERDRDDTSRASGSKKRGRRGGRGRDEENAEDRRGGKRRDASMEESRRQGRKRNGKQERPVGSGENRRLEFDEVRGGPLDPSNIALEEDDDTIAVEFGYDAPLATVGDPGPISVIRTGIDQTEKKGKRKKKSDGAARELSKEVSHQPALQAFKMSTGDPRGHEATWPRKPKRQPAAERKAPEQPFQFDRDFERIEELFSW